jgi:hypothetical protein
MLAGKRVWVTGVANHRSLAWAVAQASGGLGGARVSLSALITVSPAVGRPPAGMARGRRFIGLLVS